MPHGPNATRVQRCPMFIKGNRYIADWRDRRGQRKRKSFTTAEAAEAHEAAQKLIARPKGKREEQPLPRPSRNSRAGKTPTEAEQPISSSKHSANSTQPTSPKKRPFAQMRGSLATATHSRGTSGRTRPAGCFVTSPKNTERRSSTKRSSGHRAQSPATSPPPKTKKSN